MNRDYFLESFIFCLFTVISEITCDQTYCIKRNEKFPCEHGCCGDYKDQHCCSFAGLIVGIIIGVALLIAVIAGIVYCWLKKKWRKENRTNFTGTNHNCNGTNVTVLHQTSTMAIATGTSANAPIFPAYTASYSQSFPPPYSVQVPPNPKCSPPPYTQPPPPYSSVTPMPRSTLHSIGDDSSNNRRSSVNSGPPPVS